MVLRIHRGIAAAAAGALLALGLAAAPAVAAPGVDRCGADGRLPRPQDHRFYVQCAAGVATVHACPTGQVFAAVPQVCDTPDRVRPAVATVAGAGPAKLNGLLFGVKNLNATVRIVDAPAGLDGVPITFTTLGGRPLCTAVTDQFGEARCDSPARPTIPLDELLRGYRATYAGIGGIYLTSSATAPVSLF
ncbi:chitin binding peritrophin-A domain-containing protein [Streptomyces sp. NPDC057939]|uniref:chitin binding peritrophin-A domain-containing protein n=1 Tax=Streptomyces sp. NPDC057939 TaxID=3346284 RepID=UPI0036EE5810